MLLKMFAPMSNFLNHETHVSDAQVFSTSYTTKPAEEKLFNRC